MGYRLKRTTKGFRILYYLEKWSYEKPVVQRSSLRRANLEDISNHGQLKDMLAVLVSHFILPLKFYKALTEEQAKRLLFSLIYLRILSGMIAIFANNQGLDTEKTVTDCMRKAFAASVKEAGVERQLAVGISVKNARIESFIPGLLEWLKIRHGGTISKIDSRWRLTLPNKYAKYVLGWNKEKKVHVIPYPTDRFGGGFLIVPVGQDKQRNEEKSSVRVELCLHLLEFFTVELTKNCCISNQELDNAAKKNRDFTQILPNVLVQYLSSLNVEEIMFMHLGRDEEEEKQNPSE